MKNIFKFLSIALMAGAMMVACGDDPVEPTDTTPDTPQPPAVNHNIAITWDGAAAQIGFKNATKDDSQLQDGSVITFEAAKGLVNDEYEFPAFIVNFVASNNNFGHASEWNISGSNGDNYFPTEAYIEGGIEINGNVYGDWALEQIVSGTETEAFDATALTVTADLTFSMYDFFYYYDLFTRYQNGEVTEDEANELLAALPKKTMTFTVNGYNL